MTDSFKKALAGGAWTAVGINAGVTAVTWVLMIVFIALIVAIAGGLNVVGPLELLVLSLIFGLPGWAVLTWSGAGLIGSLKDALEGRPVTFGAFVKAGLHYFWRFLGFGLLFGLAVVGTTLVLGFSLGAVVGLATDGQPDAIALVAALGWLIAAWATFTLALPMTILTATGDGGWNTVWRNYGTIALFSVAVGASAIFPFAFFVTLPLYELFILSLAHNSQVLAPEVIVG
ncbi:MAG: hypothetical protein ACYC5Y_06030 [Symbiobacteriia bacterium]